MEVKRRRRYGQPDPRTRGVRCAVARHRTDTRWRPCQTPSHPRPTSVRRAALPAARAAAATAAVVLTGGPLQAFADAFARALAADPRWVVAAAVFEIASFTGYIALLWLVGSRATPRLGPRESAQVTLGGAAVPAPAHASSDGASSRAARRSSVRCRGPSRWPGHWPWRSRGAPTPLRRHGEPATPSSGWTPRLSSPNVPSAPRSAWSPADRVRHW